MYNKNQAKEDLARNTELLLDVESNPVLVQIYIQYLDVLQKGRVKPDKHATGGSVYDSLDNIPDIEGVKRKIARLLGLDEELIENLKEEQADQRTKRSTYYNNTNTNTKRF